MTLIDDFFYALAQLPLAPHSGPSRVLPVCSLKYLQIAHRAEKKVSPTFADDKTKHMLLYFTIQKDAAK